MNPMALKTANDMLSAVPHEPELRGFMGNLKASELPLESIDEFSNAPFEFEESAKWLWDDTRVLYYHAGIENRYSENYLKLCGKLETNIRRLGSFCLTKAVMETKGIQFPELSDLDVLELVKMVSFHLRKCHAAFQDMYQEKNFLGISYLNWEFRWFDLGSRLKATAVKIDRIRDGRVKADSLLEQTEKYKNEPRTNDRPDKGLPRSLHVNPSALPLDKSLAHELLRQEEAAAQQEAAFRRQQEKEQRELEDLGGPSLRSWLEWEMRMQEEESRKEIPDIPPKPETEDVFSGKEDPLAETQKNQRAISEEEARTILIKDAKMRQDQESLKAIPEENVFQLHERWERYCKRVESGPPVRGAISDAKRKKLREKRKKKK